MMTYGSITTLLLNKVTRLILKVSFRVIIDAIKSTNNEILKVIFELSFLNTPKTNKNIIDSEINISGNTKLRFSIYLTITFKLYILIKSFTETSTVLINGSG
jgi:hypothetical protein